MLAPGGGGGVLSLEKGIDCGPTAGELWLSQANIAKKEELFSHFECVGSVKLVYIKVLCQITNVCIQSCSKNNKNNKIKSNYLFFFFFLLKSDNGV